MSDGVEPLILDLLEWVGPQAKPYRDVIDAWHTSCPRLPVWEEARERGYFTLAMRGSEPVVSVSDAGARFLAAHGRARSAH